MEKHSASGVRAVSACLCVAVLTAIDQLTKYLAQTRLQSGPCVVIPGVFEFRYLENRGAAFSILQNQRWFFLVLTCAFLAAAIFFYVKIPPVRKMKKLRIFVLVVISGALGNLIDRAFLGYVRDFLYFSLIEFPIFNVADIYVTVSAVLLVIYLLFFYKEEDFSFLKKRGDGDD